MFCQYCGTQIMDDAAFCSKCGKQVMRMENVTQQEPQKPIQQVDVNSSNSSVKQTISQKENEKTKIVKAMSSRFVISGILLSIFGIINALLAILMLVASAVSEELEEFSYDSSTYKFAMVFYVILAIVGFSWGISRFVSSRKMIKNNTYSANGVINSSLALCFVFVVRIILNLNVSNAWGVFLLVFLIAIIVYEIIGIIIFAYLKKNYFKIKVKNSLDEIKPEEYIEEPSKWDEILKNETIEPIDENEPLFTRYMDYRKDKLVEILDKPENYQEIAVKVARYVFYKRFCN